MWHRPGRAIGSGDSDRGLGNAGHAAGSGQHVVRDCAERLTVAVVAAPNSGLVDMIRLLVVDEHPVIGEGIRAILNDEPDFWVETVIDVNAAHAALDARHHDIVICEVRLQGRNAGLDLLRHRREDGSAFIMFSAHCVPSFYAEAVERGAAGFLSKTATREQIVRGDPGGRGREARPSPRPR